LYQT
jgi:hypothetical protein